MARRGRPRKAGKRHPCGKRVQNGNDQPSIVQPSAWVATQVKRYGQHYCWALGRAYASGLIGEGIEAKGRLQGGVRFARLHSLFFGSDVYTCPLDDSPRGSNVVSLDVDEYQERNREWLRMASIAMENSGTRPYVEQLISSMHTDTGPDWLDRLLDVIQWNENLPSLNAQLRRTGKDAVKRKDYDTRDVELLTAAVRGLDIVAPPVHDMGILAAHS